MKRMTMAGVVFFTLTGSGVARSPVKPMPFEGVLRLGEDLVLKSADSITAGLISQAKLILDRLFWDGSNLERDSRDLKWRIQRLAARARDSEDDPFLRSELRRLLWDLRNHSRESGSVLAEVHRLERQSPKDKDLLLKAQRAHRAVSQWSFEARWLSSEARFAGFDLRRAGYSNEAWDIDREARDAQEDARQAEAGLSGFIRDLRSAPEPKG